MLFRSRSKAEADWFNDRVDPKLHTGSVKLFDDRNRQMAQKIDGYLATGQTHFIVVGAGHLVGETGLLKLLARKYRVTQE